MANILKNTVLMLSVCALAACGDNNIVDDIRTVSGSGGSELTPAQRDLQARERDYANARLGAAATGAAAALFACQVRGCNNEQRIAAVVLATTAGYAGGVALTRDNQGFQVSQESLQRDLQLAREERQGLTRAAQSAERVLAFQRSEVNRLNAAVRNGSASVSEYRASYNNMRSDLSATRSLINNGDDRVSDLNSSITAHSRAGINTSSLEAERAAQQRELRRLRNVERNMVSVLGAVPPEVRS